MEHTMSGNGGTAAVGKIVSRSLRCQDLPKSQTAAILAQALEGEKPYEPTAREVARYHDVPESYISAARMLSTEERKAKAEGKDTVSLSRLLAFSTAVPMLPAPQESTPVPSANGGNGKSTLDDVTASHVIANMIGQMGAEHFKTVASKIANIAF
jgi:hypothetical protein